MRLDCPFKGLCKCFKKCLLTPRGHYSEYPRSRIYEKDGHISEYLLVNHTREDWLPGYKTPGILTCKGFWPRGDWLPGYKTPGILTRKGFWPRGDWLNGVCNPEYNDSPGVWYPRRLQKICITQRNLNQKENIVTHWSVAKGFFDWWKN